jgi:hypothetical protein
MNGLEINGTIQKAIKRMKISTTNVNEPSAAN